MEFGGSLRLSNLGFSRPSTRQRWRHASGSGKDGVLPVPPVLPYENVDVLSLLPVVSPHILGEVLVASERGAVVLWTVGRGFVLLLTVHSSLERGQSSQRVIFHVFLSGYRKSVKMKITCTSMQSRHGDGASSLPTHESYYMLTGQEWSSQTSG